MSKNYYVTLGVRPSASESDIRQAFASRLNLALIVDAEGKPTQIPGYRTSEEVISALGEAFETLADPAARKEYDARQAETPTVLPHHVRTDRGTYRDILASTSGLERQVRGASRQYEAQEMRRREKETDVPANTSSLMHRLYESTIGRLDMMVQNFKLARTRRESVRTLYREAEQNIRNGLYFTADGTIERVRQLAEEYQMNVRPYEARVVRAIYAQVKKQVKGELYHTAGETIDRAEKIASYQGISTDRLRREIRNLTMQHVVELHKRGLHHTAAERTEFAHALGHTG